ncbi:dihydrolipoamide acetyltransferase family protein [Pseudonocardia spinosispora]|uniref:dihydrolipoamide acetyltransferase family protein n=1 Tax=Pseudonocardia spinosispora TaxID=103441 RepID=UPI000490DBAF|nr:dihydrolipoamide acetyltransferase family protein [Pseudonocardia spinosispora]
MSRAVFTLPDLGEGLTEAELVRWLVSVGDTVAVDAPVAELETAKAVVEVPTPFAGVIAELHGAEGSTLAVGAALVSVEQEPKAPAEKRTGSGNVLIGYGTSDEPAVPRPRRHRGRTASRPVAPAVTTRPRVASPIVRKLARDRGLDLTELRGSGPDGLIVRADVEAPPVPAPASAPAPAGHDPRTGLPIGERVPLRGIRQTIADTLSRSRREIPEATTWVDVDATALLDLRAGLGDDAPGLLAFVARFVLSGLRRFPALNSRVDTEKREIQHLDGVNLGIAAQTDRGLIVPAVRDADRRTTRELDSEIRRLITSVRAGTATAAETTTSSFTLNNYGVLGVDGSAAIINHPEAAILGLGRIIPRPWVVDGEIVPRRITQLSLVFDHRVCDGGVAGGFLRHVADSIEDPTRALVDL